MDRAAGALSIVIPPWNGVFGKYLAEHGGECDAAEATTDASEDDSPSQ
jgi:hypothetical protein